MVRRRRYKRGTTEDKKAYSGSTRGTAVGSGQGRFRSKASGPTRRRKVSPTLRRQR